MDRFSKETESKLDALIKEIEPRVGIDRIDYGKEEIVLRYVYNKGTKNEFVDHNFHRVNTSMESVPCAIWEVVNAVYRRCI